MHLLYFVENMAILFHYDSPERWLKYNSKKDTPWQLIHRDSPKADTLKYRHKVDTLRYRHKVDTLRYRRKVDIPRHTPKEE